MTMTVNSVGDQPLIPGSVGYLYTSDQLIAGDLKIVTRGAATITGGASLPRGTVMGQLTIGAVTSAPLGGNTGDPTNTLLSAGTRAKTGVYKLRFLTATTWTLTNPYGEALPNGVNGAYANPEINFTVTAGGTPAIAGDGFDITVAAGASTWKKAVATAVDGSQVPAGILAEVADASGGDVNGGIYLTGEFNENRITYDNSFTLAQLRDLLRPLNIFLKSAVTADPAS